MVVASLLCLPPCVVVVLVRVRSIVYNAPLSVVVSNGRVLTFALGDFLDADGDLESDHHLLPFLLGTIAWCDGALP